MTGAGQADSSTGEKIRTVNFGVVVPVLLGAAAVWSALSVMLFLGGHSPTGPSPFPKGAHYAWQAAILPLALLFAFVGASKAIRTGLRVAAVTPKVQSRALTWSAVAFSSALIGVLLIPDVVVYRQSGFAALAPLIAWTAPATFVASVAGVAFALWRITEVSVPRAVLTALAASALFFFLLSLVVR